MASHGHAAHHHANQGTPQVSPEDAAAAQRYTNEAYARYTSAPSASSYDSGSGFPAGGVVLLILLLFVYFIPSLVAGSRKVRNGGAIFVLNLLLGWTFVGWVVALVWACANDAPPAVVKTDTALATAAGITARFAHVPLINIPELKPFPTEGGVVNLVRDGRMVAVIGSDSGRRLGTIGGEAGEEIGGLVARRYYTATIAHAESSLFSKARALSIDVVFRGEREAATGQSAATG